MVNAKGSESESGSDVVNITTNPGPGKDPTLTFKTCNLSYTKEGQTVKLSTVCQNEVDGKEAIQFIEGMLDSKEIVITPPKIVVE